MKKVLVIDDETGNLNMFRLFLRAYGYEVLLAENGRAGLDIAEKQSPSIVFTDIKMPGMDGLEVLKRLKQLNPLTEVIVMTGHGDMDLAVKALNLNATDFINKPIHRSALDAALARAEERLKQTAGKDNEVLVRHSGNVTILEIRGNVTSRSEQILMDAYHSAASGEMKNLLLVFEETSSVNGAGIAVLIQLLSESKKQNQQVGISGISENYVKIFDMVGITRFADVYKTEADAMAALGK
ncbi:MAG: response regulator [Desulfococcaceae bacterium]